MVFASRRREQGASAGGGGEQHLRARLWLAVDVRRHLLLVLVARAPLPPRSRHTKGHLPSEWMRVRMSDLDTALEGAHADVSGGTGACAGQRAAAATWCEEAARSPRPPLFLPAGGLLVPSKSAKPAPAKTKEAFGSGSISFSGNTTFYIARRLWRSAPGIRNAARRKNKFHAAETRQCAPPQWQSGPLSLNRSI